MYYNAIWEKVHALEDAIEADNVNYVPQPIRSVQEQVQIIPTQNNEFVTILKSDVSGASFLRLGRDAIATLFDLVGNPLNNLLELSQRLVK